MSMSLNKLVDHHARYRSDQLAVVFGDQRLTWKEFDHRVNSLSNALIRAGVGKGEKVATVLPNCLELLTLYWSVTSIGAVVVPVSPLLQPRGLINLLQDSSSRMVFLNAHTMNELIPFQSELNTIDGHGFVIVDSQQDLGSHPSYTHFVDDNNHAIPNSINVSPEELFNIVYSSGTTGQPKGIEHSHHIRSLYGSLFANSFRMTPESVILHTGSIVFNGAFVTLMPAFFLGATYILHQAFDAEAMIRTIRDERVTHTMMVPAQIAAVLESPNCTPEALISLQMVLTLGAPLDQSFKDRLNKIIPNRFYELYGLTEGFVTILDKLDFDSKPDSVGCPPLGYEIKILSDTGETLPPHTAGEIVGRGPILMLGYHGRPQLTQEAIRDGWLFTGDLGYLDEDGFLYLQGRKKELIISGGVNVFPKDIEGVALSHPDVLEAAVFGVDSAQWGETPVAALVMRAGADLDSGVLKEWINARVEAKYQRVSDVMYADRFPLNVAGKVLKHELKELYCEN